MQRKERKLFSSIEDMRLIELVTKFGKNWRIVAMEMPERSSKQCKERYELFLDPKINLSEWSEEEDNRLIKAVDDQGRMWTKLSEAFNRNPHQLKNRYNYLMRHKLKNDINFSDWENKKEDNQGLSVEKEFEKTEEIIEADFSVDIFKDNFDDEIDLYWCNFV